MLHPAKIRLASLQENKRFADEFRQKLEGLKDRKFQVGSPVRQPMAGAILDQCLPVPQPAWMA